ncbi:MAG: hypothetical protein KC621_12585 [Myxococcales bacterium]|nr:hypothetical protein [Myxococcales bacterium]
MLDPTRDPGEIERREVQHPRGTILVRWYGDGRVEATCAAPTELEGGPPSAHLVLAPRSTGDAFFDRAWAVTRGAFCCTAELRREILGARSLVVRISARRLWVCGLSRQHGEDQLVAVVRRLRSAMVATELEGARRVALDDPLPDVRVRAWDRLAEEDPVAARAALMAARTSADATLRMEAGRRLKDEGLLLSVVLDPSARPPTRRAALTLLATPGACVLAIDALLRSEHHDLRHHALRRLRRLEGSRALDSALAPWTSGVCGFWSPDEQELLARQTARLLRDHPGRLLPELVLLRFLPFGELRPHAVRGLAARGTLSVVPRLRLLQDLDPGGADELESVVQAIHARHGGAGTLMLAEGPDGRLALADRSGELDLVH